MWSEYIFPFTTTWKLNIFGNEDHSNTGVPTHKGAESDGAFHSCGVNRVYYLCSRGHKSCVFLSYRA